MCVSDCDVYKKRIVFVIKFFPVYHIYFIMFGIYFSCYRIFVKSMNNNTLLYMHSAKLLHSKHGEERFSTIIRNVLL
jgi:hypothetical protein